jgi:hypothetical protein
LNESSGGSGYRQGKLPQVRYLLFILVNRARMLSMPFSWSNLAKKLPEYINVEEDFIRNLFLDGEAQLGRTFVNEEVLLNENALHILSYGRASEVIRTAAQIGIGVCYWSG